MHIHGLPNHIRARGGSGIAGAQGESDRDWTQSPMMSATASLWPRKLWSPPSISRSACVPGERLLRIACHVWASSTGTWCVSRR